MQQYQASKPEPTETQSTLQLLLTKSSLNPHSVGSTVKADVKQGPVVVSPTSPVVAMTPTTLMSSAVSSKTEATGEGNIRAVFGERVEGCTFIRPYVP